MISRSSHSFRVRRLISRGSIRATSSRPTMPPTMASSTTAISRIRTIWIWRERRWAHGRFPTKRTETAAVERGDLYTWHLLA